MSETKQVKKNERMFVKDDEERQREKQNVLERLTENKREGERVRDIEKI